MGSNYRMTSDQETCGRCRHLIHISENNFRVFSSQSDTLKVCEPSLLFFFFLCLKLVTVTIVLLSWMHDSVASRLSREHLHASAGLFERRRSGRTREVTSEDRMEDADERNAFERAVALYNRRVSLRAFKLQSASVSCSSKPSK